MNFNEVSFEYAAGTVNQLPVSDLPEIVFSGHSNVGKSSLLNKLVREGALGESGGGVSLFREEHRSDRADY